MSNVGPTLRLITLALLSTGCQAGPRECWGDCALPGEVVMGMRDDRGEFVEVRDGDPVDLTLPIQGGHVLFVGARIKNFEKHAVTLLGEVRHPDSGAVVAQDERRVDFTTVAPVGYGQAELALTSNVANIAVCPNYLSRDMVGQTWLLDVTVTDSRRQPVKVSRRVLPSCRQNEDAARRNCQCECLGCFTLGKCASGARPTGCDGG